jgi:hypothetical protein
MPVEIIGVHDMVRSSVLLAREKWERLFGPERALERKSENADLHFSITFVSHHRYVFEH